MTQRPRIGITCDVPTVGPGARPIYASGVAYAQSVERAGGAPLLLPPIQTLTRSLVDICDAFIFTGGGDPRMEAFGAPTHPKASLMDPTRQGFEVALFRAIESSRPRLPVLGICLGMQLMSLVAGGMLDQCLAERLPTHEDHDGREHLVRPEQPTPRVDIHEGLVASHHRQGVTDPGRLCVIARSHDGLIEGVCDPSRPFHVGVQWHPERTTDPTLGDGIFRSLVRASLEV